MCRNRINLEQSLIFLPKSFWGHVTVAVVVMLWSSIPDAKLLVDGTFEGGTTSGFGTEKCCSHSIVVNQERARSGKYACKFEWRTGDRQVNNGYRTELVKYGVPAIHGKETWVGFSVWIPSTWKEDKFPRVVQFHEIPDGCETWRNPTFCMVPYNGNWTVLWKWNANACGGENQEKWVDVKGIEKNVWVDWVVHHRWAYDNTGLLEVWKNGRKVVDNKGPNQYNDKTPNYFKIGYYHKGTPNTIYFDDIRVGDGTSSFNEVKPGQSGSTGVRYDIVLTSGSARGNGAILHIANQKTKEFPVLGIDGRALLSGHLARGIVVLKQISQ